MTPKTNLNQLFALNRPGLGDLGNSVYNQRLSILRGDSVPGILIVFSLLFIATVTAWYHRKAGIALFMVFLVVALAVFLQHATDHLGLHF